MRRTILTTAAVVAAVVGLPGVASAETTTSYVVPSDLTVVTGTTAAPASCPNPLLTDFCGWERDGGSVDIGAGVRDSASGEDHLLISTAGGSDKAYALSYEFAGTPLADVDQLRYRTYIDPATTAPAFQVPALNVTIDPDGPAVAGGFATLVWEQVYVDRDAIARGEWQQWTPSGSDGGWWGTRAGLGFTQYGASWADVQKALPDATVLGIGVNQGGGNPGLLAQVDLLQVNGTVYDFEGELPYPTAKEQCKKNGWAEFTAPGFRNQGQCVSWVARQSGDA